jgi:hypothetical protein
VQDHYLGGHCFRAPDFGIVGSMSTTASTHDPVTELIRLDGLACAASAVAVVGAARWLDDAFGIPVAVLVAVGLGLAVYALALFALVRRGVTRGGVKAVIAVNALWTVTSVVVAIGGWLTLTAVGTAFVLLQATAVAAVAALEIRAQAAA